MRVPRFSSAAVTMSAKADRSLPELALAFTKSACFEPVLVLPVVGPRFWLIGLLCGFDVVVFILYSRLNVDVACTADADGTNKNIGSLQAQVGIYQGSGACAASKGIG